jgi:thiamine biosynthesis protein ThiS
MQIRVNGEVRTLPETMTIAALLDQLRLKRDGIAVEVNRRIVPRAQHVSSCLKDGDVVEVVTFVGGG